MIYYVQYLTLNSQDLGEMWENIDRAYTTPESNWTNQPKWLFKKDQDARDSARVFAHRLRKYHTHVRVLSLDTDGNTEVVAVPA